ncbi:NAD(P)H-hydrate dehydratase [Paracoccus sp. Z118]|uniref:NAD(P)H-hydrate dehydratase n=1 Tax=Paracoccus sp. Z118 TaxID=2851017 RepID=UPI001C2C301B|nr:NAD(P)H-hydrate dehydratase [Paracoccus sp. Z118]MBV0890576.1 NAD(P)H-hydrate dehydratase [Paracoccus sp. Z118]
MKPETLLTAAQMRAVEAAAIASCHATGAELMERAGRGVVGAMLVEFPELGLGRHHALVLCGPGNNGGDGFVVARLLLERGWNVTAWFLGTPAALPPDAKLMHGQFAAMGGNIQPMPQGGFDPQAPFRGDAKPGWRVIVDALFGTGLTRPLDAPLLEVLGELGRAAPEGTAHRIAVDAPSGLCLDSGRVLGEGGGLPSRQDLTVTFHAMKRGHLLAEGPEWCGKLRVVDIGLSGGPPEDRLDLTTPGRCWAKKAGHKYDHGHCLVIGGGPGQAGAARLAAKAALRVGAGLVTLALPSAALPDAGRLPDAVIRRPVDTPADLRALLQDGRITSICLGPGLGHQRARDLLPVVLAADRNTVLDADALTSFADDPEALLAMLHARCLLTPHGGEFARVFPHIAARLAAPPRSGPAYSRADTVRDAVARAGCAVLLKGPDTVIGWPGGHGPQLALNAAVGPNAAPWLATAGAGDVLAGMIAGLAARGPLAPAACSAAWLHAAAARRFGPGLIADDLPEQLPALLRDLTL